MVTVTIDKMSRTSGHSHYTSDIIASLCVQSSAECVEIILHEITAVDVHRILLMEVANLAFSALSTY